MKDDKPNEHGADNAQGTEDSDAQDEKYEGGESGTSEPPASDPGDPIGPGKNP